MKPFLTAEWLNLAMANYEVAPATLLPYLPPKTELDTFNNICYVSLVAFRFFNTRVKGIAVPFHTNFEEINLRFYVRFRQNGEWKRGVVFIKEIVPRFAITFIANAFYQEKYQTMPTWSSVTHLPESLAVKYRWGRRLVNEIDITASSQSLPIAKDSEEEFITEHYWGYAKQRNNTTKEYKVEHPRWNVYPVKEYKVVCDFEGLYGKDFAFLQQSQPLSILLAQGSAITVYNGNKI
ncbi:MAG: YqjF family protein [Agriterribacter sp.]